MIIGRNDEQVSVNRKFKLESFAKALWKASEKRNFSNNVTVSRFDEEYLISVSKANDILDIWMRMVEAECITEQ